MKTITTFAAVLAATITLASVATPVTNSPAFAANQPEGTLGYATAANQPEGNNNSYATASYANPQGNNNAYATAANQPEGNGNVTFASYARPQGNDNAYATASYADPETHHGTSTSNTAIV